MPEPLPTSGLLTSVREQIEANDMVAPNERWLLAVSGGMDSMAMLHALIMLKEHSGLPADLHVAHLNHQLRAEESEQDAEFVRLAAETLKTPISVETKDIESIAKKDGKSLETCARDERYHFLVKTAKEFHCHKIVTAHNADDQTETILYRILRGTGLRGLSGIPAKRRSSQEDDCQIELIRPLLTTSRETIEQFVQMHQISFRNDSSNEETTFTRNRIRHSLLPLIKEQFNPNIFSAIQQLGNIAQWQNELLHSDIHQLINDVIITKTSYRIELSCDLLRKTALIQQAELLHEALKIIQQPLQHIGYKQIKTLLDLVNEPNVTKIIQLPDSLQAEFKNDILSLNNRSLAPTILSQPFNIAININGTTDLSSTNIHLWTNHHLNQARSIEINEISGNQASFNVFLKTKNRLEEWIDADSISGPLLLRSFHEGDRFSPLGLQGDKKLGDHFTDCKWPNTSRHHAGLLCDNNGIIAILGDRISNHVKIRTDTSKVYSIKVHSD